ncbi:hypothetical protein CFC21_051665, partial [Triticum aestivum]
YPRPRSCPGPRLRRHCTGERRWRAVG